MSKRVMPKFKTHTRPDGIIDFYRFGETDSDGKQAIFDYKLCQGSTEVQLSTMWGANGTPKLIVSSSDVFEVKLDKNGHQYIALDFAILSKYCSKTNPTASDKDF